MAFKTELQEETFWCWAAVSVSIDRHFDANSTWTQCQLASRLLGIECCAQREMCNTPQRLQEPLQIVGCYGNAVPTCLTFGEIERELKRGRPVCCRVKWQGGGGHFVVIKGCWVNPTGEKILMVSDPWYGDYDMFYDDFVGNYQLGSGSWTGSYFVHG